MRILSNRTPHIAWSVVLLTLAFVLGAANLFAQETTASLRGSVKDPGGLAVPGATVTVSSSELLGVKKGETDSSGQFIFANLPAGVYTVSVTASGFNPYKREGLILQTGHFPSIDVALKIGGNAETVEVSGSAPVIDVTSTQTQTNVTSNDIADLPHGRSFQSVIQLAPAARNEPLQGASGGGGFQIAGGADSENAYLVEGQDTGSIVGGASSANVPFEFINEVQIKTTGVDAAYAGALGGVVNATLKHGGNVWHGNLFASYQSDVLDAGPNPSLGYDPKSTWDGSQFDSTARIYSPKKDHYRIVQPGFDVNGAIIPDRLWISLGFAPQYNAARRTVDFGGSTGLQLFTQDTQTYYGFSRVDFKVSNKIRTYASWLTQYQRQSGSVLPGSDSVSGQYNSSIASPLTNYNHGYGYVAPNQFFKVGADYTISPTLVSTTTFGHFFQNYGDRGYTSGSIYNFQTSGLTAKALTGAAVPSNLQVASGYFSSALNTSDTQFDAQGHDQLDENLMWFKSTKFGTHNIKGGYTLNHLTQKIYEGYNGPLVRIRPGYTYAVSGETGRNNCAAIEATNRSLYGVAGGTAGGCRGLYGVVTIREVATSGDVSSYNHGLYVQDAWSIAKGFTINAGLRADKEYLPNYNAKGNAISFGWGAKIAPRLGAAWDVFGNGKLKVFGNYGVFYDQMKLNLAMGSFGGEYWHNVTYALDTANYSSIIPAYLNGHYTAGTSTTEATFQNGVTPAGLRFIENIDYRTNYTETVDPNLKPYRQHESSLGAAYKLNKDWALELTYDRRRLDHAIEDAGLLDADGNEYFQIINPGEGSDKYIANDSSIGQNIRAARSYDGVEVRAIKSYSNKWAAQLSYTWSNLRGNYTGLTSTDLADGGVGGRDNPNNNRSFDEPYFEYSAYGRSSAGVLPTDRPHTFKGQVEYSLPWGHGLQKTTFGLFQQLYSGSPLSSYINVGAAGGGYSVYVEGRGKWADVQQAADGSLSVSKVYDRRTPIFSQSDFTLSHNFKLNKENGRSIDFQATFTNLFNQRSVVTYYSQIDSSVAAGDINPDPNNNVNYSLLTKKYDWKSLLNADGITLSSLYGKPLYKQSGRTVRFRVSYSF